MRKLFALSFMFICLTVMTVSNVSALTTINYDITSNMTLGPTGSPADTEYLLSGSVYVKAPAQLTIQPGTKIYGDEATIGTLIIERGAKIHATGTPTQPIVFTKQPTSLAERGKWGGVIIAGNAPINLPGGEGPIEGVTGNYGGSDPADNSGELQYVRIEYAGHLFTETAELNGLALHGVGSGTTIDHVQVLMNKDDCIEMFGGTVNMKYMIGTWCRDDSFDWTEGWQGKAQFVVVSQRADEADAGIEADNYEFGHDNTPRSNPTIYNMTMVGDPYTTYGTESTIGMRPRRGTAGTFKNFIVTGFKSYGIRVDDTATVSQITGGNLVVSNSIVSGNTGGAFNTAAQNAVTGGYWTNINTTVDPELCNPLPADIYSYIDATKKYMPNFAPVAGSPAIDGTVAVATPPADGFFDAVNFIGAVDPTNDWTYGWTSFGAAKQKAGDLDYNGTVNVLDVVKIKKIASSASPYQSCSDLNNDISVNLLDVVKVKRRASGADAPTVCCTE